MKNYVIILGFVALAFALFLIWGNLSSQIVALESETGSYIVAEDGNALFDPYDFDLAALHEQLALLREAQAANATAIETIMQRLNESGSGGCTGAQCASRVVRREIISFGYDDSTLTTDNMQQIDELLASMRDSTLVILRGHTDTRGSNLYNQLLSLQRAASVKRYIDIKRDADSRLQNLLITVDGVGEESTVRLTADEVEEPSNRIVEILIYE